MESKSSVNPLQIVGMSATIPNLSTIAKWLHAELYVTDYRPVPLLRRIVNNDKVHDVTKAGNVKPMPSIDLQRLSMKHEDILIYYAIDTLVQGFSALVFCPTKADCERLAKTIAITIVDFGKMRKVVPENAQAKKIRDGLNGNLSRDKIKQLKLALEKTPFGYDRLLETTTKCGVAYHHAGLSSEERSIIEKAYRDGAIRILCSTTTLSAGKHCLWLI